MITEINGVKMDIDLREAKQVTTYKIGDNVKLLYKEYSSYNVYPGVIVDFVDFQKLPTIVVAYVDRSYSSCTLKFAYINDAVEDKYELAPCCAHELELEKNDVINQFDKEINRKELELEELKAKRKYFIEHFNKYFEEID